MLIFTQAENKRRQYKGKITITPSKKLMFQLEKTKDKEKIVKV